MIVLLRLLAAYVGLLAVGAIAAGALARGRTRLERAALALPLGATLVSMLAFWLSLAGVTRALDVTSAVVAVGTACGAVAWFRRPRPPAGRSLFAGTGLRLAWGGAAAMLVLAGLLPAVAVGHFAWDGLMVWGLKARIFALEGHVPTSYFVDVSRQWSHLDYPLGLPLTEAWIYRVAGGALEGFTRPLFLGYLLSLLGLLYAAARRGARTGHAQAVNGLSPDRTLALLAALAITPQVLPLTTWGYADLPLATLVLASATSLWLWLERGEAGNLLLAGVAAAAGAWTKREGAVFWPIAAALVAFAPAAAHRDAGRVGATGPREWGSRARDLLRFAWPVLALVPWFAFLRLYRVPDSDFALISGRELAQRLSRVPRLAWLVVSDLGSVTEWGILWLLIAAVVLRGWRQAWSAQERWFAGALVAYVGSLSCSYLFSTWVPWQPHVTLSAGRLIFHVTPVAVWLAALRWRAGEMPDSAVRIPAGQPAARAPRPAPPTPS